MQLIALASAIWLALAGVAAAEGPRVRTEAGVVEGAEADGVRTFRNIPYAAPPVGDLRWAPPQRPASWTGVRAATAFGPPCAQLDVRRMAQARRHSDEGVDVFFDAPISPKSSEDCLTLNVWAPAKARRAPVIVYLYGGGGSADMPFWSGGGFARDGVVLVNFNFRNLTMGKFAHPALTRAAPPDAPLSRYDVMDQLAALSWVQRNIAAFGGDPRNVTLAGVSAGGAGVLQLLTVPAARGLFHKAAVQSGNGWWTAADQAENERLGVWLAREAGLPGVQATASELRAAPVSAFPQIGHFAFDGRLMPQDPTTAIGAGRTIDVPLMIGWNSNDGSSLRRTPAEVLDKTPPEVKAAYASEGLSGDDLAYALYTDSHVAAPARWIARKMAGGAPVYLYRFSHVRAAERSNSRGAAHASELPYVFDSWRAIAPGLTLTSEEAAVTRMVHSCWVTFARTGRPACEGAPPWPRYTTADDRLMDLGTRAEVRRGLHKARLDAQEAAMADTLARQRAALDRLLALAEPPP